MNLSASPPSSNTEAPAIKVEGVLKRFGAITALEEVSFEVQRGSVTGFIGANGAGKTTTMRILATLESADDGTATICGVDVAKNPTEARRVIGWMPDSFGAYENMTVWEYLDFFARAYGCRGSMLEERVAEVVEFTDLAPLLDRAMNKLSKGLSQRLCLGRTLLHDPEVLILDEPAAGLDPKARLEFKRLIQLLADAGKTILISSHIISELGEMCDSLLFIDKGHIIHHGDKEILTRGMAPGGGAMLEIRTLPDATSALQEALLLDEAVRVSDKIPCGFRVTLNSGDDKDAAALLVRLVSAGVPIADFHRVERRLEEAFVDVVSGKLSSQTDSTEGGAQREEVR